MTETTAFSFYVPIKGGLDYWIDLIPKVLTLKNMGLISKKPVKIVKNDLNTF
jgi:hypothetical protein